MEQVQAFKCEFCQALTEGEERARTHVESCRSKAEQAATQAGIRARWMGLQRECKHPNATRTPIPNMPGSNDHVFCPDCGHADNDYDPTR